MDVMSVTTAGSMKNMEDLLHQARYTRCVDSACGSEEQQIFVELHAVHLIGLSYWQPSLEEHKQMISGTSVT